MEKPFGSTSVNVNLDTSVEDFLTSLNRDILEGRAATIFIQGDLVEQNGRKLRALDAYWCALGLHGYDHELWGWSTWFLDSERLNLDEKKRRLCLSLDCFEKSDLKRPVLFRAPNLLIDNETLKLLSKYDFLLDSSFPSFQGCLPLPASVDSQLLEVPITCDPLFELKMRKGVAYCFHRLFDFRDIYDIGDERLFSLIECLFSPNLVWGSEPYRVHGALMGISRLEL